MAERNEEIFDIGRLERRLDSGRIRVMESTTVIRFTDRRERQSRISRAMDARRRLEEPEPEARRAPGRAWINGVEVDGDGRLAYLSTFHD